jgi:lysozyme
VGAILDFVYNLGPRRYRSSTLRRRVNEGRWEDVPTELRRWVYGGGKVLPGLKRRREAEASLIRT